MLGVAVSVQTKRRVPFGEVFDSGALSVEFLGFINNEVGILTEAKQVVF